MEKIASAMLDKLKTFAEENPELVKTTLLAGGIGALGGAMIPSSREEDEESTATERVGRKLKNALIGATVVGGAGALLSNAAKNFNNAKFQRQLTPEEKTERAFAAAMDTVHQPATLSGLAIAGGLTGGFHDRKNVYKNAERLAKQLSKADLIDPQTGKSIAIPGKGKLSDIFSGLSGKETSDDAWKALRSYLRDLPDDATKDNIVAALERATGTKGAELRKTLAAAGLQDAFDITSRSLLRDAKGKLKSAFGRNNGFKSRVADLSSGLGKATKFGGGKAWRHLKRNKYTYLLGTAVPTVLGLGSSYLEPDIEQ